MKQVTILVIVSLMSALSAIYLFSLFSEGPKEIITIREQMPVRYATNSEAGYLSSPSLNAQPHFQSAHPTSFIEASSIATPAVVNIRSLSSNQTGRRYWGTGEREISNGSGVIISSDGYIVTNNHVINNATSLEVTLNNNRMYKARVIGTDPSTDLALIKLDVDGVLPYLEFADSDGVQIGEWVLAVGNPFNLTSTVTAGIVSAKGRNINILEGDYSIESFIQTDAAVNPGNSGGALVNTRGQLIGVNTAIITRSGRYEGYSFAVPANLVYKVISDIQEFGKVQRGFLGVTISNVDERLAKENNLANVSGVLLNRINPGSAAEKSDLKEGDIIIAIDDREVRTIPELQELVARYRPGNTISITYVRKGKELTTNVTLKNAQNTLSLESSFQPSNLAEGIGFDLRNLTETERDNMNITGVKVISIVKGSKVDRTNMDPGFIITHVNDQKINSVEELIQYIQSAEDNVILEGVYEEYPGQYYYAFVP
jgi:serine protease Do